MQLIKYISLFILIVYFSGCIQSINPLYTDKDLILNPDLIGEWTDSKSSEKWTFYINENNEYRLTHSQDGEQSTFQVHLLQIGDHLFLDLFPDDFISEDYLYQLHLFPVHTFSKISITKEQISISMFDPGWVKTALQNNQITIDHTQSIDETILLTASTEDLQDFVLNHVNSEGAFFDPILLTKKL